MAFKSAENSAFFNNPIGFFKSFRPYKHFLETLKRPNGSKEEHIVFYIYKHIVDFYFVTIQGLTLSTYHKVPSHIDFPVRGGIGIVNSKCNDMNRLKVLSSEK
jgi:hypothetical protein